MNKKEQELFIAFFDEILEAEEASELIKKQLTRCLAYNPTLIFQLLSARSDFITIPQLRAYLEDKVACNSRELYELFEKFDWSRNGRISRDDFIREITPFGSAMPALSNEGTVTAQIEGHFLSLLTQYLKRFRIIEVSRKEVDFIAPYNAFDQIDYARSGLVGLGELQRFFTVNDFNIAPIQLDLLLHGLRRRCYLEVNLEVFCQNLNPLEFGHYQAYQREIEEAEQTDFLKRSRREEETMKRSRIQSQKIEHNIAKDERRRIAELERERELEERVNQQIRAHEDNKERYLRRAILEDDKNIRWNVEAGSRYLEEEKMRNLIQSRRNEELRLVRDEENQINHVFVKSALQKEDDLQASRRARLYEREVQMRRNLEIQQEMRRKQMAEIQRRNYQEQQRKEIQMRRYHEQHGRRERQMRRNLQVESEMRRKEWGDLQRRNYDEEVRKQRDLAQRQYDLERIRQKQMGLNRRVPNISESRHIQQIERELERTRVEMKERQSRLDNSMKRGQQTAERSFRY